MHVTAQLHLSAATKRDLPMATALGMEVHEGIPHEMICQIWRRVRTTPHSVVHTHDHCRAATTIAE